MKKAFLMLILISSLSGISAYAAQEFDAEYFDANETGHPFDTLYVRGRSVYGSGVEHAVSMGEDRSNPYVTGIFAYKDGKLIDYDQLPAPTVSSVAEVIYNPVCDIPGSANKICEADTVVSGKRYRISDSEGNAVSDVYSSMRLTEAGILVSVYTDGGRKWKMLSANGEVIADSDNTYINIGDFYGGIAAAQLASDRRALINERLERLDDKEYKTLTVGYSADSTVLIAARQGNKGCIMDAELNAVFKTEFTQAKDNISILDNGVIELYRDFSRTYENGKFVLNGSYYEYLDGNYEPLFKDFKHVKYHKPHGVYVIEKDGKYALFDKNANIISEWYDDIKTDGYVVNHSPDTNGFIVTAGDKNGIIGNDGKAVTEVKYSSVKSKDFFDGWLCIFEENGRKYTDVYNSEGVRAMSFEGLFREYWARPHFSGAYNVHTEDHRYAFIDEKGKSLTGFDYDEVYDDVTFSNGIDEIKCYKVKAGDEIKYLDENFREYIPAKDRAEYIAGESGNYNFDDTVVSCLDGRYALIDKRNGSYIIPSTGEMVLKGSGNTVLCTRDGKTAVLDEYGTLLREFDREIYEASHEDNGIMYIKDDRGCYYIDKNGENIFDRTFKSISLVDDGVYLTTEGDNAVLLRQRLRAVYTDIRTLINGYEIPCFSVNDRNVITAEDLRGYGFDVSWDGEKRELSITRNAGYHEINPVTIPEKREQGSLYSDILPADINVYFNGTYIRGYSIDGEMLIKAEDLETEGIITEYNDEERVLYLRMDGMGNYSS